MQNYFYGYVFVTILYKPLYRFYFNPQLEGDMSQESDNLFNLIENRENHIIAIHQMIALANSGGWTEISVSNKAIYCERSVIIQALNNQLKKLTADKDQYFVRLMKEIQNVRQ